MDKSQYSDTLAPVLENNFDSSVMGLPLESQIKLGGTTHATAKNASKFLLSLNKGFCVLSKKQRRNVVIAYAEAGFVLYGKAFDLIRCDLGINYDDLEDIRNKLNKLVIYEIKSTNKKIVKTDFSRYHQSARHLSSLEHSVLRTTEQ
jgi:hypothetical protein